MSKKIQIVDVPCRSDSKTAATIPRKSRFTMRPGPKSIKISITSASEAPKHPEPRSAEIETTDMPADYSDIDELADELLIQLGLDGEDAEELDFLPEQIDSKGKGIEEKKVRFFDTKAKLFKPLSIISSALSAPSIASTKSGAGCSSTSGTSASSTVFQAEPTMSKAKSTIFQARPTPTLANLGSFGSTHAVAGSSSKPSFSERQQQQQQQQQGLGSLPKGDNTLTHPTMETVYADIIDLADQKSCSKVSQTSSRGPKFGNLLRKIQSFTSIRTVADRPTIKIDHVDEPLGVVLEPPAGSTHFEVQLTICGLLQKDSASAYELYFFFLENGFFRYLPTPPSYKIWASDYLAAIKSENLLYREGIRVGIVGDMDFLRTIFRDWVNTWHDWRLERPIPSRLR